MIILPRQARDKHTGNSKKDAVFRTGYERGQYHPRPLHNVIPHLLLRFACRKHLFFSFFCLFLQLFPMFVPSLSWQIFGFWHCMASQQRRFIRRTELLQAILRVLFRPFIPRRVEQKLRERLDTLGAAERRCLVAIHRTELHNTVQRHRRALKLQQNGPFFWSFSYACREPVLVKS